MEHPSTCESNLPPDDMATRREMESRGVDRGTLRETLLVVCILGAAIWLAQFVHVSQFGLYEDDWAFVGHPMGWSWSRVVGWAVGAFQAWWIQGRPVGFAATALSVFFANRIAGLAGVYVFAYLLHLLNAGLVFVLARRRLATAPALCAALGFALLPSDTSVPLLTNGLFMGFATFFLLAALIVYQRGSRMAGYLLSLGSLLTFESAFLPFFAAPLFEKWDTTLVRRLVRHWAILLFTGATTFVLRSRMGEAKTSAVLADGAQGTLYRIAVALVLGPFTTLSSSVHRAIFVITNRDGASLAVMLVFIVGLTVALCLLKFRSSGVVRACPASVDFFRRRLEIVVTADERTSAALQAGSCGLAMLVMAYGLAISSDTYPPIVDAGRLSGCTHMGAAAGFGLFVGALVSLVLDLSSNRLVRAAMAVVVACYFGVLGSFHYLVQKDFTSSWNLQRTFWRSVVKECPDITDGTVLIFEDLSYPLRFVQTNSWADPHVLGLVYRFPEAWAEPPRLFSVPSNWRSTVVNRGGKLVLSRPFGAWPDRALTDGSVILLKSDGAGVRRVTGSAEIGGQQLRLKDAGNTGLAEFQHGPLYRYVLEAE
jgi:hypothetical protein